MTSYSSAQRAVLERLPDDPRLREIVGSTPVGGRGQVDWTGTAEPPPREQLRVLLSVLLRVGRSIEEEPPVEPRRRLLRAGPAFHLAGHPSLVAPVRRALAARGHREGGLAPVRVVLLGPVTDGVAGLWRRRVEGGAGPSWQRQWRILLAQRRLPQALDPERAVASAHAWTSETRVVVADTPAEAARLTAAALGIEAGPAEPPGIDVTGTDLLRRLNHLSGGAPFGLRLAAEEVRRLGAPEGTTTWRHARTDELTRWVGSSDLQVDGEPASLTAGGEPTPNAVLTADTLDRAVRELENALRRGMVEQALRKEAG